MGGDFRIGDRVYIAESSAFRGQCSVAGTITRKTTYALPWHVDFDNGYGNDYGKIDLAHDTDINVGDRIRVTTNYWGVDYPVGSIQEVRHVWDTGNGRPYELATGKWCNGFKVSNDTPLTKDNIKGEGDKEMDKEQVTRNGYVYTKLKSLSPESVLKGNPCKGEFDNYVKEATCFYGDYEIKSMLNLCEDYPSWLPWLISHGYIGKEEVKKKVEYIFKRGDRYMYNNGWGDKGYILMACDSGFAMVNLADGCTMNGMFQGNSVTVELFRQICGSAPWEKVYATRIPYVKE